MLKTFAEKALASAGERHRGRSQGAIFLGGAVCLLFAYVGISKGEFREGMLFLAIASPFFALWYWRRARSRPQNQRYTPLTFQQLPNLLFSLNGRVERRRYLIVTYSLAIVLIVLPQALFPDIPLLANIAYFACVYPVTALQVKRFHDMDMSGWSILFLLIPLVNLWAGVRLVFKRGTNGPNRFGPSPI